MSSDHMYIPPLSTMSSHDARYVLQELYQQVQLLASLHWLNSFQVLAFIPQQQSVTIEDVAEISGVPSDQLLRSLRVAITAGFLREPLPGHIEHTALSIQFIKKPYLSDATAFICERVLPAAMQMDKATRLQSQSSNSGQSAYNLISQASMPLLTDCERQPKLKRQVTAYERLRSHNLEDGATEVLSSLDWASLGNATVVQVGPRSITTVCALANSFSHLRFIIQFTETHTQPNNGDSSINGNLTIPPIHARRISIQTRPRNTPQSIKDGNVYILHLLGPSLTTTTETILDHAKSEIKLHLDILKTNPTASLIIITEVTPEPNTTNTKVETAARSEDLLLMQMTSNSEMLSMSKLRELVNCVGDCTAGLVIVNQLLSETQPVVALQVKLEDRGGLRRRGSGLAYGFPQGSVNGGGFVGNL